MLCDGALKKKQLNYKIMFKEEITKAFCFGSKVKFIKEKTHPDLVDKVFCLVGFNETAFALIEWEKRGQYDFEFYTGSIYADLQVLS